MTIRPLLSAGICCLACWMAVSLPGCRPSTEQLAPVKGKVVYQGRPLPGGTIIFIPDSSRGTQGSLAMAEIQSDGSFTLKTNEVLGAVVGHHRVTLAFVYQAAPGATPQSVLPAKYRDPQLSGLTREVVANTPNTIDFDLD